MLPILIMGGAVIFFLSYNVYLVDHSLEDLKLALDVTSRSEEVSRISQVSMLIDDVLINEVSALRMDSMTIANLEFTKNIVQTGRVKQQLQDMEFLLNKIIKEKEKERGAVLTVLDRMNRDIMKFIKMVKRALKAGMFRPELFRPKQKVDLSLVNAAKAYETHWQLKEAIKAYTEFISRYPDYRQIRVVKLRLADTYFKMADYYNAKKIYEQIIQEAPRSDEANIAEVLLVKVKSRMKKMDEKKALLDRITQLTKGPLMQKEYKELDIVDLYLERLDKETKELVEYVVAGVVPKEEVAPGIDLSLIEEAKTFERRWQLKKAIQLYRRFIERYPHYGKIALIRLLLGGVYLKSMDYKMALKTYKDVMDRYPGTTESETARRLIRKTKELMEVYNRRKSLIEKISRHKLAPKLAEMYYRLGIVSTYLFDIKMARESFIKVIELQPGTELAKKAEFRLGWVYKFGADYKKSAEIFSKLMEKYPNEAIAIDSRYHLADGYYKWGRYEDAAQIYERFAKEHPASNIADISLFHAGYTLLYDLHDPTRAAKILKKLRAIYPEADTSSYSSVSLIPTAQRSYRDYGFILLREGKIEEAKEVFKKAIEIDREDAWAYGGLGTAYCILALPKEGAKSAAEAVKKLPDEYTHAAMGFVYDANGEYLKAIEAYKASIAINNKYMVAHYNLARDYVIIGWYDYAIKEFKETIKLTPDFAEAHNNLGLSYWYKGNLLDAEYEFKTAIHYKKNCFEAHYNLGLLFEISERYRASAQEYRRALEIMPDFKLAQKHLKEVMKRIK